PERRGASVDRPNRAALHELPGASRVRGVDLDLVVRAGVGDVDIRRAGAAVDREPAARGLERDVAGGLRSLAKRLVGVGDGVGADEEDVLAAADAHAVREVADEGAAVRALRQLVRDALLRAGPVDGSRAG